MSIHLKAHPSNTLDLRDVLITASAKIDLEFINISFNIKNYHSLNTNDSFSEQAFKNWGLWEYDVVEVFLRDINKSEYYEFQVSLNNKRFTLAIKKAREVFYAPLDLDFKSNVYSDLKGEGIMVDMHIKNFLNTREIEGNYFAILGSEGNRGHFSRDIDWSKKADFHDPKYFEKLS